MWKMVLIVWPWSNESASGSGSKWTGLTITCSPSMPSEYPNTRSLCFYGLPGGTTTTVPANEAPTSTNGRGNCVWYFLGHCMMKPGKEGGRATDTPWQGSMKFPHPISVCAQTFTPHSEHMANGAHADKGGGYVGK